MEYGELRYHESCMSEKLVLGPMLFVEQRSEMKRLRSVFTKLLLRSLRAEIQLHTFSSELQIWGSGCFEGDVYRNENHMIQGFLGLPVDCNLSLHGGLSIKLSMEPFSVVTNTLQA
jgi:hypothetical protein